MKLCLKRIEEYLCKATVSTQTLKEDFFGDQVDRSDEALWRDDGHTRSFSVTFKAVLVATADVVKRQYHRYFEMEVTEEMKAGQCSNP